jgi:hypothetical protein
MMQIIMRLIYNRSIINIKILIPFLTTFCSQQASPERTDNHKKNRIHVEDKILCISKENLDFEGTDKLSYRDILCRFQWEENLFCHKIKANYVWNNIIIVTTTIPKCMLNLFLQVTQLQINTMQDSKKDHGELGNFLKTGIRWIAPLIIEIPAGLMLKK